jgi:hypothetical protein
MMSIERLEEKFENHSDNVGIGLTLELLRIEVPTKCKIRIKSFGNYLGTVAAWGVAYWTYFENGIQKDFAGARQIMDQIGYAAQRQPVTVIEVEGGSVVQFYGVNPTAAILSMGISIGYEIISRS